MDEGAIGAAGTVGNTPAKVFTRTGEDLADATAVLETNFVGGGRVNETASFDDGEEAPADLRFLLGGEFNGDDAGRESVIEQRPEAFAHTGGIDDDMLRGPLFLQVLDPAENGEVIFTGPGMTGKDAVGGIAEGFEGGEVDADDGEGGGVTAGVAETFSQEGGGEACLGFVHAGDVEEEGDGPPLPFGHLPQIPQKTRDNVLRI